MYFATDINEEACKATMKTFMDNGIDESWVHVLNTSFGIGPDQCYDIIIFNPPYVPTTPEELALAKQNHDITAAWAGG